MKAYKEEYVCWKKTKHNVWEISNLGNVKKNGDIYTPTITNNGYKIFCSSMLVHRAVAEKFIVNNFNKPQVNHKDGNKLNNSASNLEWVTVSENHIHAYKNGLKSKANENHHFYNKELSYRHRKKLSFALIGRSKDSIKCPWCDKVGGAPAMHRWHFNNCKHKGE